ncbi:hypothetical protein [Anaerosporobacter sp.]|uniref:hypothetical protein n=1 Tax=Anaerosporobacter sp. TaxID=1872529 RepID=UPI00286F2131|nr:hypothetical protein [Anaerosporobacter sp.]
MKIRLTNNNEYEIDEVRRSNHEDSTGELRTTVFFTLEKRPNDLFNKVKEDFTIDNCRKIKLIMEDGSESELEPKRIIGITLSLMKTTSKLFVSLGHDENEIYNNNSTEEELINNQQII